VARALSGWHADGRTAIGDAIQAGLRQLTRTPKASRPPAAMVLLSDGTSTNGSDPIAAARQAAAQRIRIDTVALGTPNGTIKVPIGHGGTATRRVPPDPQGLARIAHASGGQGHAVQDASQLNSLYAQLGVKLGHQTVKRQIADEFAGGALVLVLLGSGMSLRWFGRLI
jgi:Ca-activated chloride channel family protein